MNSIDLRDAFPFLREGPTDGDDLFVHPERAASGEVRRAALEVAAALRREGREGGLVLVDVPKGRLFAAGYFGSLLAGMTPLFMDTSSESALADVAPALDVALTSAGEAQGVARIVPARKVLRIDGLAAGPAEGASVPFTVDREAPACVLLTSGTTGEPKRFVKSVDNVLGEVALLSRLHGASRGDAYCCAVPWVHIYGFLNGFLVPLAAGATVLAPGMFLPHDALALLARSTVFVGVPVQYRLMLDCGWNGESRLRCALSSGTALPEAVARRFLEEASIPILDIYGSTETGGVAARRSPAEEGWTVLPGIEWRVAEDGELVVRSPLVHRSLLGEGAGGWLPTGDCVRLLPGGGFALDGRKSGLIKAGGRRVSAREVEEALMKTGLFSDAVVVPFRGGENGGEEIGAALAARGGGPLSPATVRKRCATLLPPHKLPDRIVFVESIPRSSTGKVRAADIERLLSGARRAKKEDNR